MKIIFLIPPSEGKNSWWNIWTEKLSFSFNKPYDIAKKATESDLKCTGDRYKQGIELNMNIDDSLLVSAISRYSGVMYNAIDYIGMNDSWKKYFLDNFLILTGMYGLLSPENLIWNYKLPIETKGLYKFWDTKITQALDAQEWDIIVDLLPHSYKKMIDWGSLNSKILRVDFFIHTNGKLKKMTHWIKKVKGEYIKKICEACEIIIPDFWDKKEMNIEIIIK
jgi:hypothetical protein